MKSKAFIVVVLLSLFGGLVAHADDTPNLNGTWLFRGIKGQNCTITQTPGGRLELVTEKGDKGSGTFENDTMIVVDFPFAHGLKGSILENGFRIKWSNGESWMRAADRQPLPGWYVAARPAGD